MAREFSFLAGENKGVELVINITRYPLSALLYVDSDMFFGGNLTALSSHFAQGGCVMHLAECRLADNTDKQRESCTALCGKTSLQVLRFGDDSLMWNAGVIGLCAQKSNQLLP